MIGIVALGVALGTGGVTTQASGIPYGTVLVSGAQWAGADAALGDLNVYSNGAQSQETTGTFGRKYECTELAQRWAYYKFGEPAQWPISSAAGMWNAGPSLPVPLAQESNGGASPPQFGDIIVFAATGSNPTGHVAVVSAVTPSSVTAVHQNFTFNGTPTGAWTQSMSGTTVAPVGNDPVIGWLRPAVATVRPVTGPLSIHLAPVEPPGQAASPIAVNDNATWVLHPGSGSFSNEQVWSSTPFYGTRATLFANLDGPGKPASAVAVNDSSIFVMKNANGSFGSPALWSTVPFYGSRATLLADIDGSGYASAVAINDSSIWVMRVNSAHDGFLAPQLWSSSLFYGSRGTFMADVDGSGRASAVAINDQSIWVLPNHGGTGFDGPQLRSRGAFYGSRGTFMADVDGSGHASAVAMNDNSIWVEKNTGGTFAAPAQWSSQPFYGTSEYMADLDGSGRAAAIAVTPTAIWVEPNTGSGFGPPSVWFGSPFFGSH